MGPAVRAERADPKPALAGRGDDFLLERTDGRAEMGDGVGDSPWRCEANAIVARRFQQAIRTCAVLLVRFAESDRPSDATQKP